MPSCPKCGSSDLPCPCEVASWIEGPSPDPPSSAPLSTCTACGFSGELNDDARGACCPACGVVVPRRRSETTSRVARLIVCPECHLQIGVTVEDAGKTLLCPGCSYFLGTPSPA